MVAGYVIVDLEVTDPEAFNEYRQQVAPTIEAYGGRYLVRGGSVETVEGEWKPKRVVVLEFPSVQRAKEWWSSEEYREPKALRQRAAETHLIIVEGL